MDVRLLPILSLILAAGPAHGADSGADLQERWHDEIWPIIDLNCIDCHGEGISKGEFDFEDYPDIASMQADRETWKRVRGHLQHHLMPPPDEWQPESAERQAIIDWIDAAVFPVDPDHPDPGRVTLRRLNRIEYQNTLRDLLGVDVEVIDLLPPDDTGYGFDTIGDVLTLSPAHLERFLEAARVALDAALHVQPMPFPRQVLAGSQLDGPGRRSEEGHFLSTNGEIQVSLPIPRPGRYRVEISASGSSGGGQAPRMLLRRDEETIREWFVEGPIGKPGPHHLEVHADGDSPLELQIAFTNDFHDPEETDPAQRDRNLLVHELRLVGPIDGPRLPKPESHRRIFGEAKEGQSDDDWALDVFRRFAHRAFRRPVDDTEIERYLHFVRLSRDQGQDTAHGIRLALEAMLVSPSFLYREEPQPEPDNADQIHLVDEHTLASRLSYFLWSTMPDERLLGLADEGRLREELDAEIDRMVGSPRFGEFVSHFPGQWLELRDVRNHQPSKRRFPDFKNRLLGDMRRETELLFGHLLRENRPMTELLDADYSFLNERLARHYGIEGVEGRGFRKVSLEDTPRRGLLGHGSFHLLTSFPVRTSPVLRGAFVLGNLLDTEPPPPPPNIPQLGRGKSAGRDLSLRQQMEKHREDPSCAACHALLDPIGFGLENFDADGTYRSEDRAGRPIDASGTLNSGREFVGADELRAILLEDHHEEFLRSVASKMLTYAIGRGTDWYDKPALDRIVRETTATDGGARTLLKALIRSTPFQYRRGDG